MRVKFQFAVIVTIIALISYFAVKSDVLTNGEVLAPIHFYGEYGNKVTLGDFKGDVVLVNLWASWCAPCIAEIPSLAKLQNKFYKQGFKVVAISLDKKDESKTKNFLDKKSGKVLKFYLDKDRQVSLKWKYEGLPTSFLIDQKGYLIKTYQGPREWGSEDVVNDIIALF